MPKSTNAHRLAHDHARRVRGLPDQFTCACGCGEVARHWALKPGNVLGHSYLGRLDVVVVEGTPMWFSDDPWDLIPMAPSCHREMDAWLMMLRRSWEEEDREQPALCDLDPRVADLILASDALDDVVLLFEDAAL